MFYPCSIDLKNLSKVKQGIVVLTPAESKRLLAKAVAGLPEVQWAYANGKLAVTSGTTDSFVVEELTGEKIEPYRFCVGMSAVGMLTMSAQEDRVLGRFYDKGQRVDTPYPELIKSLGKGDVIIKGANAVDPSGNAGVLLSNDAGGLVGAMFGVASARGIPVISPVGLEKQIVSVPDAAAGSRPWRLWPGSMQGYWRAAVSGATREPWSSCSRATATASTRRCGSSRASRASQRSRCHGTT
jgi:hypothetical protein